MAPVQCDFPGCSKIVSRKADLTRHKATHSEDGQIFVCPSAGCKYETTQQLKFNVHMATHSEARLHCPECDQTLKNPSSLLNHRKRHHGYCPRPYRDEVELFFIWSCS
ncbi:hypothetical protein CPC08DRAFT_761296 [Agrocybe pediades]|nr:hypothetical protein CPC08DRAFT_761296 [Agrocybe pediades]